MCKITENTMLRVNERMAKYKISSSNQAANTDEIVVSTNVLGKTYERSFSMKQINDMFGRALNRVVSSHGKTL